MRFIVAIVFSASLALPSAVAAQLPTDVTYCNELARTYRRVVGLNPFNAGAVPEAIARCDTHPEDSIPTLERALRDRKVTLPRSP